MSDVINKIVVAGIRNFERRNPGVTVSRAAKKMLHVRTKKHRQRILSDLRNRRATRVGLTRGLEELLERAVKEQARWKKARKAEWAQYSRTYGGDVLGQTRATALRIHAIEVSSLAVVEAMGRECKTFPWC